MSVISKGRHDIVIKQEGKTSGGFFKVTKKQYPIYPFHEEKIKCDEYGEIIKPEEYKLAEIVPEAEDNKENVVIKKEEEVVRKSGIFGKGGRVECFFLQLRSPRRPPSASSSKGRSKSIVKYST
jgi:hypothetical protein